MAPVFVRILLLTFFPTGLDDVDLGKTDGRSFNPDSVVEGSLLLQLAQAFPKPLGYVRANWNLDGFGTMSAKYRGKLSSATEEDLKFGVNVSYDR